MERDQREKPASTFPHPVLAPLIGAAGLSGLMFAAPALAQAANPSNSGAPSASDAGTKQAETKADDIWQRDKLLGDVGGLRPALDAKGISLNFLETSEVLGNVSGGMRQGAIYEGALLMSLSVDTQKFANIPNGTFYASAYQIRGRGLTATDLDNLAIVSNIEAPASTRLFELRYEQSFFDGKASIRFGQLAADQEFIISQYAGPLFINSGFGWPTLAALDLPEGGPAYPLATPGIRFKGQPNDALTLLAGIFNGNPADNGSGTTFAVDKGVFVIGEAQYAINGGDHPQGLPGTYKIGAWFNSNQFPDQRLDIDSAPLANPADSDVPLLHRGNWSVYATADQMLYKVPGTKDQGLGVFARIMGAPDDRNLVDFNLYGGATYKGLVPGRPDDSAGLGVIYTRISNAASQFDVDTGFYSGSAYPVRSAETVVEATYLIQMAPWWTLQPDFQYVFNPGANIPDPLNPSQTLRDAAVFGLRTTIAF